MTTVRQQRVSELLFQELSILVSSELEDPRLDMVDVIQVNVSRDLRSARVYVYHQGEDASPRDIIRGLERATPYLRSQLAERCGLRLVPDIFFAYDDMPQQAARIDELLQQIAQERAQSQSAAIRSEPPKPESATAQPDTAPSGVEENL